MALTPAQLRSLDQYVTSTTIGRERRNKSLMDKPKGNNHQRRREDMFEDRIDQCLKVMEE